MFHSVSATINSIFHFSVIFSFFSYFSFFSVLCGASLTEFERSASSISYICVCHLCSFFLLLYSVCDAWIFCAQRNNAWWRGIHRTLSRLPKTAYDNTIWIYSMCARTVYTVTERNNKCLTGIIMIWWMFNVGFGFALCIIHLFSFLIFYYAMFICNVCMCDWSALCQMRYALLH